MTEQMKNLFDYATKELSQDAFLRWLFENYNCKNEKVRQVCRKLFNKFKRIFKPNCKHGTGRSKRECHFL